jgi:hypothetical protein
MPFHTIIGHEDIEIGVIGFFLQMVAQRGLSTLGLCDNKAKEQISTSLLLGLAIEK